MEYSRGFRMRILSVRPSVCPSDKRVHCDKKERKICAYFYTIRTIIYPSFLRKRVVDSTDPHWSEIADFEPIIARSASAVTPSEKSSIATNRKSTTRFQTSLWWSSYVASKGGSKKENGSFPSIIALLLKKVCYKVSLCENCQRQSCRPCRAFIGLTNHAKMIGGDVPFYLKFWVKLTALERNRRFSVYFRP